MDVGALSLDELSQAGEPIVVAQAGKLYFDGSDVFLISKGSQAPKAIPLTGANAFSGPAALNDAPLIPVPVKKVGVKVTGPTQRVDARSLEAGAIVVGEGAAYIVLDLDDDRRQSRAPRLLVKLSGGDLVDVSLFNRDVLALTSWSLLSIDDDGRQLFEICSFSPPAD